MPRYDYKCTKCENEFELTQSFSEAGKGTCPDCSGEGRRIFHSVPVIYKGSGFYTTDYGRQKSSSSPSSKPETKKAESTTTETKSDSPSSSPASDTTSTTPSSSE
ncbi:MAG: FmdB family transcriptional regulator [SAR202 cluster bacterium]|nr:FmdB family transcriptional regulator [SAR202 cluster bacterium]